MPNKLLKPIRNMSVQTKYNIMRMAAAVGIGLALALVLITLTAEKPGEAIKYFLTAPFMRINYFSSMIETMIPILFTGTAVCVMFSANQFNLGLEGAFYMGGFVAALSSLYLVTIPGLSQVVAILLGGVIGAFITFIPAFLERKWGASVMVSSLMMNYICLYIGIYFLFRYLKDPASSGHTYPWDVSQRLPKLIPRTNIHAGIVIALLLIVLIWLILYKTRFGFKVRLVGANNNFAKYAGLSIGGVAIGSQLLGGLIGGIGGAVQMLGMYERFNWLELTGFGWDGVTLAIFAKNNPKNVPFAALFIAYLRTGTYYMSLRCNVQYDVVKIVEGIMILFLLAEQFLFKTYKKMIFKEADQKRKLEEQAKLSGKQLEEGRENA